MSKPRGTFIVLEGLDRSGKSTQTENLIQHLNKSGKKTVGWKFPERTTSIGKTIDSYLKSETNLDARAIHLLFSANRWECKAEIERLLAEGTTIVCDRYAYSGLAFSLAKKSLPLSFLLPSDTGLPLPDITLFLSLPLSLTSTRADFGTERYEIASFQAAVKDQFQWVGKKVHKTHGEAKWKEIDASGTIDQVWEKIWKEVEPVVNDTRKGPLEKLWVEGA